MNFTFTSNTSSQITKYDFTPPEPLPALLRGGIYASVNPLKTTNLSHLLLHSRSNPNILTTNKSTFQFIKSVNWIQVAVPRQALHCVPNCILWPWWMGCQLRKTGWFQLKTLLSAPHVREKNRQDFSMSWERPPWPHFWPGTDLYKSLMTCLKWNISKSIRGRDWIFILVHIQQSKWKASKMCTAWSAVVFFPPRQNTSEEWRRSVDMCAQKDRNMRVFEVGAAGVRGDITHCITQIFYRQREPLVL